MTTTVLQAASLPCVLAACLPALGQDADPARVIAMDVCARVRSAPNVPDSWADATVTDVQSIESPKGRWRLARLAKEGQEAGYVLLAETAGGLVPAMYSASAPPLELVKLLAAPASEAACTTAPQIQNLPDVPMIAVPALRDDRMHVTPLACAVAGMCMWVQEHHRVPFAYLRDDAVRISFLGFMRQEPGWGFNLDSPLVVPSPEPAIGELTPFYEERSRISRDPKLVEPMPDPPAGSMPEYLMPPPGSRLIVKDHTALYERVIPALQSNLMKDLSRPARWALMQNEAGYASCVVPRPHSEGMRTALIIQSYLSRAASSEQVLEDFARSRGLKSVWSYSDAADLTAQKLPCVLRGPENEAVLVMGLSEDAGRKWLVVAAPATVQPVMRSQEEIQAERRAKLDANRPAWLPKEPVLPPALDTPEFRQRYEELKRQAQTQPSKKTEMCDPKSCPPELLAAGGHVARLDLFTGWKVVAVNVER
ncbi:MAG: hypothetical protein JXA69_12490 [Phycisphaerae bacterium]|nr:hypothetical protein [Phycisphaerae bacterium]